MIRVDCQPLSPFVIESLLRISFFSLSLSLSINLTHSIDATLCYRRLFTNSMSLYLFKQFCWNVRIAMVMIRNRLLFIAKILLLLLLFGIINGRLDKISKMILHQLEWMTVPSATKISQTKWRVYKYPKSKIIVSDYIRIRAIVWWSPFFFPIPLLPT